VKVLVARRNARRSAFDAESAHRYAAAGDKLVQHDRQRQSKEIRRIRRKLGLSQVANLSRLLDRHPELLTELILKDAAGIASPHPLLRSLTAPMA
jgi:hypothetical protein